MAAAMREVEVAAGEIAARHGGKVLTIADARRRLAIAPWRGERWSCDRVSGVSFERRDGAARVVVWQQRGGRRSLSAPSRCEAPSDVTARSVSRWSERKRLRWHQRQIMASEAVREWRSVPGVTERRRRASARENVPSRTHTGANATARQRAVRPAPGSEHGCTVHARARARAKRHAVRGRSATLVVIFLFFPCCKRRRGARTSAASASRSPHTVIAGALVGAQMFGRHLVVFTLRLRNAIGATLCLRCRRRLRSRSARTAPHSEATHCGASSRAAANRRYHDRAV